MVPDSPRTAVKPRSFHEVWLVALAVVLIVPLLALTVLQIHRPQVEEVAHQNLATIASLKSEKVSLWLAERLGNAQTFEFNEGFNRRVQSLAQTGSDDEVRMIHARLAAMERHYRYESAAILNTDGSVLLQRGPADQQLIALGRQVLAQRHTDFSPLRSDDERRPYLDIASPLFLTEHGEQDKGVQRLVGAVIMRQYVDSSLAHLMLQWPGARGVGEKDTGENLLAQRDPDSGAVQGLLLDGGQMVMAQLPDELYVLIDEAGKGTVFTYPDRHGSAIFAVAQKVAGTDWVLVSKQDRSQILTPVYQLIFWISLVATVAVLVSGSAALLLFHQHRNTLQLKRQLEVRETDQMIERFFNLPFAGMAIASLDGQWLKFNDRFCAMLGYTREEMLATPPDSITAPDERDRYIERHARLLRGEVERYNGEIRFVRKDGAEVIAHIDVSRHQPHMTAEPALYVMIQDITEQKRLESDQRIAAAAFEGHHTAMFVTDARGVFIRINKAFTRITGYDAEDIKGRSPSLLKSGRQNAGFYKAFWHALVHDHYWEGEIWNRRKNGEVYPEWLNVSAVLNRDGTVVNYVGSFTDITHSKEAQRQIQWLSNFDGLTGLPNASLLRDRTEQALIAAAEQDDMLAMVRIDLDQFKTVNDSLSHRLGDQVLTRIALRLREAIGPSDTLSRQSGDEFNLLLTFRNQREVAALISRLQQIISEPLTVEGQELVMTASAGIALFPADAEDFDALNQAAEIAMFRAKQDGRNRYAFYEPAMQEETLRALQLSTALHRAVEEERLQLYYQPQCDLLSGQLCGVEALLRWRHPEFGWVSPAEFIPLAESNGLIVAIGDWTLRTAMRDRRHWIAAGLGEFAVAVNLSPLQFRQIDLVERIQSLLHSEQLPSHHLELELTETAAMDNPERAIEVIQAFHDLGIGVAIDDFGTGYSSMNYLNSFAVNKLKIDRSFIDGIDRNEENQAIVLAVIRMAQALGIRVLAEGVERFEEQEFLAANGCALMQGYFYGKPMPADEFLAFAHRARDRQSAHQSRTSSTAVSK